MRFCKQPDLRDEFTMEDAECLPWIFHFCKVAFEMAYDAGNIPDYAMEDLDELEQRLTRLVRQLASN